MIYQLHSKGCNGVQSQHHQFTGKPVPFLQTYQEAIKLIVCKNGTGFYMGMDLYVIHYIDGQLLLGKPTLADRSIWVKLWSPMA